MDLICSCGQTGGCGFCKPFSEQTGWTEGANGNTLFYYPDWDTTKEEVLFKSATKPVLMEVKTENGKPVLIFRILGDFYATARIETAEELNLFLLDLEAATTAFAQLLDEQSPQAEDGPDGFAQ